MRTLFIGSTVGNSGKTMITIGLAPALQDNGYKVWYRDKSDTIYIKSSIPTNFWSRLFA